MLFGGFGSGGAPLNDVWRSGDGGSTWEQLAEAAPWPARAWAAAAVLASEGDSDPGAAILVLGGSTTGDSLLDDVWRSEDGGQNWDLLVDGAPWAGRRGHGVITLPEANSLLLLGGFTAAGPQSDVWRSQDKGVSWELLVNEEGWKARSCFCAAALPQGEVLVLGGQETATGGYLGDAWVGVLGEPAGSDGAAAPTLADAAAAAPTSLAPAAAGMAAAAAVGVAGAVSAASALPPPPPPPLRPPPGVGPAPAAAPEPTPASASAGAGSAAGPPPPPARPPPARTGMGDAAASAVPPLQGGPAFPVAKASVAAGPGKFAAVSPASGQSGPLYEQMRAPELRKAVLDLQKGLADITKRLDSVGTENQLLREENVLLKEAIDDKIDGGR